MLLLVLMPVTVWLRTQTTPLVVKIALGLPLIPLRLHALLGDRLGASEAARAAAIASDACVAESQMESRNKQPSTTLLP